MEIGTNTPDKLLAGALHVVTGAVNIAASQDLKRGAVLGLKTVHAAIPRVASVTFSGTTAVGSGAVVLTVGAKTYTYTTVTGDTPTVVAAALKTLVNADSTRTVNATNTAGKLILTFIIAGVNTDTVGATSADANITAGATAVETAGVDAVHGDAVLVNSTSTDGSQVARVVLLDAVKTGASETKPAPVAKTGEFNSLALIVGGTDTISDHLDSLGRLAGNAGIFVSTNQAAIN
jgi:hypothetical protein